MREIKFRGKRLDNGEWVYGDLVSHYENQRRFIACDELAYTYTECGISRLVTERAHEVDPNTVGQYADLSDKNGKEVYESCDLHVLEVSNERTLDYVSKVEYIESGFLVTQPDGCQVPLACFHNLDTTYPLFEIEVIES